MRRPAFALAALACAAGPPAGAQTPEPPPSALDGSLDAALKRNLPMTPAMIEELRQRYVGERRAAARVDDPSTYVSPVNRRVAVSFRPGEATPIVHAAVGYPTVLSFYDNTGRPWPIAGESASNPTTGQNGGANPSGGAGDFGGFEVKRPVPGGNSVEITVRQPFPRGGLVVYLQDADKPVALMLVAGRGQYDANTAVHVAARGPKAAVGVVVRADSVETGAPHMTQMLDGITPAGATALQVAGGSPDDFRAWRLGGKVYLRTTANLVAPEPDAHQFAEGGVRVYSVPMARHGDTGLLMSDGHRNFTVSVRGN